MADDVLDVGKWVEESNCFEVMGQLRRLGVLSRDDLKKAMELNRKEWIKFIKEKIGLGAGAENGTDDCA